MTPDVKLSRLRGVLEDLDYPVSRVDAATELEPYTLRHAGGEENLGGLVSETMSDTFESPDDVENDLHNVLPAETLGELGEAEGDG